MSTVLGLGPAYVDVLWELIEHITVDHSALLPGLPAFPTKSPRRILSLWLPQSAVLTAAA